MSLNKFGKIQIMQGVFSDQNGIEAGVSNRNIFGKSPNIRKLNIMGLLNNPWFKEEIGMETNQFMGRC